MAEVTADCDPKRLAALPSFPLEILFLEHASCHLHSAATPKMPRREEAALVEGPRDQGMPSVPSLWQSAHLTVSHVRCYVLVIPDFRKPRKPSCLVPVPVISGHSAGPSGGRSFLLCHVQIRKRENDKLHKMVAVMSFPEMSESG